MVSLRGYEKEMYFYRSLAVLHTKKEAFKLGINRNRMHVEDWILQSLKWVCARRKIDNTKPQKIF